MRRTAVVLATNLMVGTAALAYLLQRFGMPALALVAGQQPSARLLLAFAAVVPLTLTLDAWRWSLMLAALGERARLLHLAAFRAAGQGLSALLPSAKLGGEPLRMYLLVRGGVPGGAAIASVAVDRTVELGASTAAACVFAMLLLRGGVSGLDGALVTLGLGAFGLVAGVVLTVRRLGRGAGVVTAVVRRTGLDRFRFVEERLGVLAEAEVGAAQLAAGPRVLAVAFGAALLAAAGALLEYHLLLAAFHLPAGAMAIVAAAFATGAAHALPVPAGMGVLEGATLWLFTALGHPPAVGLAVGLVARLREVVWVLPGLLYLGARGLAARRHPAPVRGELRAAG
ncbi:MAG TPA: lysylphosphatidylglycerol synthase transmembrane domain-containing protein [Candidatus Nitrosopolaris sp.]|nr:lysylphosphatidylglycerol synthase transmembrane domain-containing protein [Candidatus Nitrosopolaris sp.]